MKKLLVWLVKKFITKDALKAAIHAANKRIAEKPASERTQQVMAYGEDAAALTAAYLKAYANDGRIDDAERAEIDVISRHAVPECFHEPFFCRRKTRL